MPEVIAECSFEEGKSFVDETDIVNFQLGVTIIEEDKAL